MIGLTIGRYQPFHKGHYLSLRWMLHKCDKLIIAIGSANQPRTEDNPYTAEERKNMIIAAFNGHRDKLHFIMIEDNPDDTLWRQSILDKAPEAEVLFTNSPITMNIFKGTKLRYVKVPMFKREMYEGAQIRDIMKINKNKHCWRTYVLESTVPLIIEAETKIKIEEMAKKYPKFPDGRINYTGATEAVVMDIHLKYRNKYLLLKRSDKVLKYKNMWSCIGGYFDEPVSIEQKVMEEIREETGLTTNLSKPIIGDMCTFTDKNENMTWHVCPVLVKILKKPDMTFDWESQDHKWVTLKEMGTYKLIPHVYELLLDLLRH